MLHHVACAKAETCGMNLRRKADLAAIKAESQIPETSETLPIADLPEHLEHSGALFTGRAAHVVEQFGTAAQVRLLWRTLTETCSVYCML